MAKQKWYIDQRKVAFAAISTVVVVVMVGLSFIGLAPELKNQIVIPWPTCQFNAFQVLYAHTHGGVLFTNLEPDDAKVTLVNNGVCDAKITIFERLSKGGVPVNNEHATYFTSTTLRAAAKHTASVTLPAPSDNCLHDFVVVAGVAPASLPINFVANPVVSSGLAGDKNKLCS